MSLRLEMLQVARLAPKVLGEGADLVRGFFERQFAENGLGRDRAGKPDLYYTIFAIAGLQALQAGWSPDTLEQHLEEVDPDTLDFIHLGALARCWGAIGKTHLRDRILGRIEEHRTTDGGYDGEPGSAQGNAYGCFLALGAYQDLGVALPDPLRMVQCLKHLETPDGAWGNLRGMPRGTLPATAAAIVLLHQLAMPINPAAGEWLLRQAHPEGGFLAVPGSPIPDLLSTATALHALACLQHDIPKAMRDRCLDFIDTLWNAEGGFHGHWADDDLDAEYTFYGLLALGHLV